MNDMHKKELRNGDIIVTRDGSLGVVVLDDDNAKILFQLDGMDSPENYNDDMIHDFLDMTELDVMEIYHDACFLDFMIGTAIPDIIREDDWQRPSEEERTSMMELDEEMRKEWIEELKKQ